MQNIDPIMMALELQAAKYFKLDLDKIEGNFNESKIAADNLQVPTPNDEGAMNQDFKDRKRDAQVKKHQQQTPSKTLLINSDRRAPSYRRTTDTRSSNINKPNYIDPVVRSGSEKINQKSLSRGRIESKNSEDKMESQVNRTKKFNKREPSTQTVKTSNHHMANTDDATKHQHQHRQNQYNSNPNYTPIDSPILSCSNSLPSINSSPSLSPSLVCPHLSLDDLLGDDMIGSNGARGMNNHQSPHTIGLCPKCRMSPPPNLHSPLSPVFAASQKTSNIRKTATLRRGYSDQQHIANRRINHQVENRNMAIQQQNNRLPVMKVSEPKRRGSRQQEFSNMSGSPRRLRDDSLDYFLDPEEVRRSQLSPIMRHSVGFIRTHSSESSRIIKVFRNGHPYDRPLRLCIGRSEFKSLNHLLDHINDRLLISFGARYLFHLDGQLVYSVNELKHEHSYLVSGTRHLDPHTSQLIRDSECVKNNTAKAGEGGSDGADKLPMLGSISTPDKHQPKTQHQNLINDQIGLDPRLNSEKHQAQNRKIADHKSSNSSMNLKEASKSQKNQIKSQRGSLANKSPITSQSNNGIDSIRQEKRDSQLESVEKLNVANNETAQGDSITTREIGVNATPETRTFTRKVAQLGSTNSQSDSNTQTTTSESVLVASPRSSIESVINRRYSDRLDSKSKLIPKPPVSLIRAKSDSNGITLRVQKKKNVTFKDTGRGSSPSLTSVGLTKDALNDTFYGSENDVNRHEPQVLSSNEMRDIGIQVSDSIEGFLIDLPIPLPPSKAEAEDSGRTKHKYLRRGQGQANRRGSVGMGPLSKNDNSVGGPNSKQQKQDSQKRRPVKRGKHQIVTITERQLSNDEMIVLKDLDQGDHHHESPPPSPPSMLSVANSSLVVELPEDDDRDSLPDVSLYIDETIVPCPDSSDVIRNTNDTKDNNNPARDSSIVDKKNALNDEISGFKSKQREITQIKEDFDKVWQVPRGDATPSERPVSQNAANESVHARITTPTPSISTTGGDTTSLSISYETTYHWILRQHQLQKQSTTGLGLPLDNQSKFSLADLPEKERVPVNGQLCLGSNEPESNFKLVWINGFSINNHNHHHHQHNSNPTAENPSNANNSSSRPPSRLSLSQAEHVKHSDKITSFSPNERTHNWVNHSLKHDEIIYPVGRFVILWCRWTDEQRYYSQHASSVCALSLGPDETDLAVSAQISEPKENICPMIHVWSVTKLQLLHKIDASIKDPSVGSSSSVDQDLFKIFSLRLYVGSAPGGLELVAGSCNSKRLWMHHYELRPVSSEVDGDDAKTGFKTIETKAFKPLTQQTNQTSSNRQTPLLVSLGFITPKAKVHKDPSATNVESEPSSLERRLSLRGDGEKVGHTLLFSLGRRLFQVWLLQQPRAGVRVIRALQCDDKPMSFMTALLKATCWLHWSPNQLLVGDSDGNITLIEVSLETNQQPKASKSPSKSPSGNLKATTKYRVDRAHVILSLRKDGMDNQITCLTRVSNSVFLVANSEGLVQVHKLNLNKQTTNNGFGGDDALYDTTKYANDLKIPEDFGCAYCLILARYSRNLGQIDFYIASRSNSIMFASIQSSTSTEQSNSDNPSALSIVYDGHETSVIGLVQESSNNSNKNNHSINDNEDQNVLESLPYFTCSLDCKICKWQGKSLVWKSVLPSACASMALHPTGFVLAVGSGDGTIYILDKISGLLISYFPLTPVCINCLAYSRDGLLLAAGCANGSIFILPVLDHGLKYNKVSIFQSPYPVLSVQFSWDSKYILTSVTHGLYQELILWDLPNFRYMRNEVTMAADRICWYDSICSGSEDVRAIWENANMASACQDLIQSKPAKLSIRRQSMAGSLYTNPTQSIVNLSCHRMITNVEGSKMGPGETTSKQDLVIASDIRGFVRLFQYPCYDIQQGFYQIRVGSSPVNCCRFLTRRKNNSITGKDDSVLFVSTSVDGGISLWKMVKEEKQDENTLVGGKQSVHL